MHRDLRAERRLRDVHRRVHDEVEPFTLPLGILAHLEGDQDVAVGAAAHAAASLTLQPDLAPAFRSVGNGDQDLLVRALGAGAVAHGALLGRHRPLAEAEGTGTIHRERSLAEGDRAATAALGAWLHTRALGCAAAAAGPALLVDLEFDRQLAAECRDLERHLERRLDALPLLGSTRALTAGATTEHRAEEVAEATEPADVEVLDARAAGLARASLAGTRAGAA